MNETIYIKKIKHENFTTVDNGFVRNTKLSWKAKGILLYLVSLPEDWILSQKELVNHSTDGMESLRAGLKELKTHGYLRVETLRENGRFCGVRYEIDEFGLLLPKSDFPISAVETSENPTLLNTNNNQILNILNTSLSSKSDDDNKDRESLTDVQDSLSLENQKLKQRLHELEEKLNDKTADADASEREEKPKKKKTFPKHYYTNAIECYKNCYRNLADKGKVPNVEPYISFPTVSSKLKVWFEEMSLEMVLNTITHCAQDEWIVNTLKFDFLKLLSPNVFPARVNGPTESAPNGKHSAVDEFGTPDYTKGFFD